jgi:8-hydroxy-5-deazaflavin:NADPH oxidoreductase
VASLGRFGSDMRIGIIGAGRIGGNVARQAVRVGHEVVLSFAHDLARLEDFAAELGEPARVATPSEALTSGDIAVLAVPWAAIPEALEQAGPLEGAIVVDTTNQFGPGPKPAEGQTAAAFNAARMQGARYTKCFNTLTAGFQESAAARTGDERVVQWLSGDDDEAKAIVSRFVGELGYVPVDLGATATCAVMEAPRRPGAVYGEEYRAADAQAVVDAVRAGRAIPPTPVYD